MGLGRTNNGQAHHSMCYNCGQWAPLTILTVCSGERHRCCIGCMQDQAKGLLSGTSNDQLMCKYPTCGSFYSIIELRKALPSMVVDIIKQRMQTGCLDSATAMMMKRLEGKPATPPEEVRQVSQFPADWDPMDEAEGLRIVELDAEIETHIILSALFHESMTFPRASISRIRRVQNPDLWQFYRVKKDQLLRDSKCGDQSQIEMTLFHGTSHSVVDAICRSNFDWRLCGSHGTAYGQGSYFARHAKYAHAFTDRGTPAVFRTKRQESLLSILATMYPPAYMAMLNGITPNVPNATTPNVITPNVINTTTSNAITPNVIAPTMPAPGGGTVHTMFVAKVLVGKTAVGNSRLRRPPPINLREPYGVCYDSCTNDVRQPSIWVVFESAQCYPAYIIDYVSH